MKKIEYSEGFIIYDDTTSEEALCQFKEYIDEQQKFLIENGIEWVKGTILKGSGSTYAEFEGMSSVKSVQKIEAMFVTSKQYEILKELMESFEVGKDISKDITERIDNGNYLFMANLQSFERVAEPITSDIKEKHLTDMTKRLIVKPTVAERIMTNTKNKKEVSLTKVIQKKKIISPSELFRKIRKK